MKSVNLSGAPTRKWKIVRNPRKLGQQRRRIGFGAFLSITLFAQIVSATDRNDQNRLEAYRKAVVEHFETVARVVTPEERMGVPRTVEAREVNGWPFQEQLRDHVLLVAVVKDGYTRYSLVAVDRHLGVWVVKDRDGFNNLLRREGILIKNEDDASLAAQLFLSATRIGYLLGSGWELGVNVIRSPDDIIYRDASDRERLIRSVQLQPPRVSPLKDGYEYSVYAWEKMGSGAVQRYRVLLSDRGVKELAIDHLLGNVGAWDPLM